MALATRANDKSGGTCFPGIARLACDTGLSKRTVQRALKALRDEGFINVIAAEKGGRGCRQMIVVTPEKGDTMTPFNEQKGDTMTPISGTKGCQSVAKRVTNSHTQLKRARKKRESETKDKSSALRAREANHNDPIAAAIFLHYEAEIDELNDFVRMLISDFLDQYPEVTEDGVHYAFAEAVRCNVRNWGYVEAVLKKNPRGRTRERSGAHRNGVATGTAGGGVYDSFTNLLRAQQEASRLYGEGPGERPDAADGGP